MINTTTLFTIVARFLIVILNFGLVIFSTNIWGSEGKGIISIITADLAIIGFFSNVFVGGSISYFASKFKTEQILLYAYLWSVIVGITIPLFFSFDHAHDFLGYLMALSVLSSLLTTHINLFVGQRKIGMFNLYTVLQLAVHILFILAMVYMAKIVDVDAYFIAQILCFTVLFLLSSYPLLKDCRFSDLSFSKKVRNSLFDYGWKSQLSAFFQFLNNRFSFYFLEFFKGIASVGIFSVGVAFSEAIWTVSRSLALVLYSDVINSNNQQDSILKTKISLKLSFIITLFSIIMVLSVPANTYTYIFGKDFQDTKQIILLLSPGVLAISVSNIIGFYFAGINKLRILNIKSIIGLVFTVGTSFYCIPKWGIVGACIVTSISYCISSAILLWHFYQITEFKWQDFLVSKQEITVILQKLKIVRSNES